MNILYLEGLQDLKTQNLCHPHYDESVIEEGTIKEQTRIYSQDPYYEKDVLDTWVCLRKDSNGRSASERDHV
ncbi:hypothetical protein JTE90_008966 [Oedothorax gibbosus]|uniref:Uncharacterized protein n=1 Tax=Oedothorax gibbosus TaxID=931172 RepID=A0AAV6UY93_9ARAC|nr:hypothetical protein JTE90_008966 [Oedothorax gibbosus]